MRGPQPTLPDITLELAEVVSPINLDCEEELEVEEAEQGDPYAIAVACYNCETNLRLAVIASPDGIRAFQQLLLASLSLLCPTCSRTLFSGRRGNRYGP